MKMPPNDFTGFETCGSFGIVFGLFFGIPSLLPS